MVVAPGTHFKEQLTQNYTSVQSNIFDDERWWRLRISTLIPGKNRLKESAKMIGSNRKYANGSFQ